MSFYPAKCSIMKIDSKKCGQPLQEATSHPYLGVEIDNKLKWDVQYKNMTAKEVLGFLKRNLWFCPEHHRTLVRPIKEYASCCWDPHTKKVVSTIESVQRKAARFVTKDYKQQSSVTQMIQKLGWETLENRRRNTRLQLLYRILTGDVGIKHEDYIQFTKGERQTRGNRSRIYREHTRKDAFKFSFFLRTAVD